MNVNETAFERVSTLYNNIKGRKNRNCEAKQGAYHYRKNDLRVVLRNWASCSRELRFPLCLLSTFCTTSFHTLLFSHLLVWVVQGIIMTEAPWSAFQRLLLSSCSTHFLATFLVPFFLPFFFSGAAAFCLMLLISSIMNARVILNRCETTADSTYLSLTAEWVRTPPYGRDTVRAVPRMRLKSWGRATLTPCILVPLVCFLRYWMLSLPPGVFILRNLLPLVLYEALLLY